ncbi:flagellar export chaperone FliS [Oryzisolibacter sp. LB2S]|uniref:flagellar export chaperone FliS n=1 Tax=Alicycliphilus soli TaxID=3228789 RepID=UPI003457A874
MFTAMNPRAASAYQRINIETSMRSFDQHQLVSLLYEGVLGAIANARGALARGDVAAKCNGIAKAVRILEEGLMTALDRKAGGALAENLGAVYEYCLARLIQANVRNDDAMLQEVARLIAPIAQGWNEMKNGNAAANEVAQPALMEA